MRDYPRVDLTKVFVDGEFAGDGVEVTILDSQGVQRQERTVRK
jgi:hypothetical protein